jgi:hypothetical protein
MDDDAAPLIRLRSEALDWLPIDDEVVAVDSKRDLYLGTNRAGMQLWQRLAKGTTRSALIDLLVDTYDLAGDRAEADVDAFLATLEQQELLEGG